MELESAVERLYTDESLAANVDDMTAKPLLKWAESQMPAIIARFGDSGFDDAFITFKKLIKSVARLIDGRDEMDESERAEWAEKIQLFAQEIGVAVDTTLTGDLTAQSGPAIVAQVLVAPAEAQAAIAAQAAITENPSTSDSASLESEAGEEASHHPTGEAESAPSHPMGGTSTQPPHNAFLSRKAEQDAISEAIAKWHTQDTPAADATPEAAPEADITGDNPVISGAPMGGAFRETPRDIPVSHKAESKAGSGIGHTSKTGGAARDNSKPEADTATDTPIQPADGAPVEHPSDKPDDQPAAVEPSESDSETSNPTLQSGFQSFFRRVADALKPDENPDIDDTKE